jgi:hypothetical protein
MKHKDSINRAIMRYEEKVLGKSSVSKRKNNKPEKEVEKQVLAHARSLKWSVFVVESKSVFSAAAGRYLSQSAQSGFSDVVGLMPCGRFVAIELKSAGRRSTVRESQLSFLKQIISSQGFACVVDSVSCLVSLYSHWLNLKTEKEKQEYLLASLPIKKSMVDNKPLFED